MLRPWRSTGSHPAAIDDSTLADRRAGLITAAVGALWFFAISGLHYTHGDAFGFDLGYYLQAIHAISQGTLDPVVAIGLPHTYLSDNLALYIYPLALLFRLWPSPWLLLSVQALWLGAIVGITVQAVSRSIRGWVLWLFAGVLLLLPAAVGVAAFDFHFDALGGLLGLLTLLSLGRGRLRAAWILAALVLFVKEDAGVVLVAAGLWHLLDRGADPRIRRHAALMSLVGALAVVGGALLVSHLSPAHAALMARKLFYSGPGLANEVRASMHGLLWPSRIAYLVRLLLPVALLPVFVPRRLPSILAAVAINLLVLDPLLSSGGLQYNGFALPFIALASAEGLIRLESLTRPGFARAWLPAVAIIVGQLANSVPLVAALGTAAPMPSVPRLLPPKDRTHMLTTNDLAAYVDPGYAVSIIPLAENGTYLGHMAAFMAYPTIVVPRTRPGSPGWEFAQLLRRQGYSIVGRDRAALGLHRSAATPRLTLQRVRSVEITPTWRQFRLGLRAFVRVPPGIYRVTLPTSGSGLAFLCTGTTKADAVCSLEQPDWNGRPLRLVSYTSSGRFYLRLFAQPGTGSAAPAGPVVLTRLAYRRVGE